MPLLKNHPCVVTAGCKDTRLLGRECFSEVPDFPGLSRQFTKWSWQILRTDKPEDLLRGIRTAVTRPCGPVFLAFCEDLLCQEAEPGEIRSQAPKTPLTFSGDEGCIKEAARLLAGASTPLFIAGSEIARGEALAEACELADLLGMPVMTECRNALASLNFPYTHPSFRGMFEPSSPFVKNADVVLGIGSKMFVPTIYSPEPEIPSRARIIHFHSDPHEIARLYPEEISVLTDARQGLQALIKALKPLLTGKALKASAARRKTLAKEKGELDREKEKKVQAAWDKKPIQLPRLVREMRQALADDAIIVDESTRSSGALLNYYDFEKPGTYYRSSAGVLGWGMPAALGVKLANPERQVVAFLGDGSFLFSIQSLWTAAKYNIPVVAIVCNNRQYKAVKDASLRYQGISARTGAFVATDITAPDIDFCRVAAGFGVQAKKITRPEDIKPSLNEALGLGKPMVLEMMLV